MNYFTPERYLAFGNHDDEQTVLTAHQQWEDACDAYCKHFEELKPLLPKPFRKVIETIYLHDAQVLSMSSHKGEFFVTLQPETLPERLVVFRYHLVEEPVVQTDLLPPDQRCEPILWMYDELDLAPPEGPRGLHTADRDRTFCHRILLSNGWELTLRFRNVEATQPLRVIPVVPRPALKEKSA